MRVQFPTGARDKTTMRIIFLDMDGVMNSEQFITACVIENVYLKLGDYVDPEAVKRLNNLTDTSEAKIVISSSWRKLLDLESLQKLLKSKGVTGDIIDTTPDLFKERYGDGRPMVRGDEIYSWLSKHPEVTNFVIIDDDGDMSHLLPYLVRTDYLYGLQDEHIEAAKKLLSLT